MRILAVVLLLSLSGCIANLTGETDLEAPPFVLRDIDNVTHTQEYDGVLLLDFMGTWCRPCQQGVPDLRDMLKANPNLKILSVSSTDSAADLETFRIQYGVTWPMAVDTDQVVKRYSQAAGEAEVIWPSYAVVKDGRITFYNEGETLPQTLADATGRAGGVQWILVATAFAIALLAPLQPPMQKLLREENRLAMAMGTAGFMLLLSLFILEFGLPITGRLRNASIIATILGLVGLVMWRSKIKHIQPKENGLEIRAGYHFTWYALPPFVAAALAASLTSDQSAWYVMGGFMVGAVVGIYRMPEIAWSRAWLSYIAAGLWVGAMWIR